jgi:hypothetical protein
LLACSVLVISALGATCAGANPPKLAGVSLVINGAPFPANLSFVADANASSEQNVVNDGEVAVSVIEGNHQSTNDARQKVASGLQQLLEPGRTKQATRFHPRGRCAVVRRVDTAQRW